MGCSILHTLPRHYVLRVIPPSLRIIRLLPKKAQKKKENPKCPANTSSARRSRSCASTTARPATTATPSGTITCPATRANAQYRLYPFLPPYPLPIHDSRRRTDTSSSHDANRSFLTRAYPTMKHHNPHTPILIREAMNIQPRVFARYEFGKEKMADLQGMWERERWREAFMSREVGRESGKIARSMDRGV